MRDKVKGAYGAARLLVLLLALAVLWPGAAIRAAETPAPGMEVNLNGVGLKEFIQFAGKFTGRNMVFREDQIPGNKVSISSHRSMTPDEFLAVFQEIMSGAGLEAVTKGNVIYILPLAQAKKTDSAFRASPPAGDGELTSTVIRLDNDVSPKSAALLLNQLISEVGRVQEIPQARSILVQDRADRIRKMQKILDSVQGLRQKWDFKLIQLKRAKADAAATRLKEFYSQLAERGQVGDTPLIIPVDWSNGLLIAAPADSMPAMRAMIEDIDATAPGDNAGFKSYRLRNAKAQTVAQVLQALTGAKPAASAGTAAQGQTATATPGTAQVAADADTNSLVVMADQDFIARVDKIVAELDRPRDQVYVEALVMETSLDNSRKFGVEWYAGSGNNNFAGTIGNISSNSNLIPYSSPVLNNQPVSMSSLPNGFSVGLLGDVITYAGTRFSTMGAMINFLKSVSGVEILSNPQIMALDNAEAEIFVGENRPYMTSQRYDTASTTTAVPIITYDYRDVGIKLKVKPQINPDNGLILLNVEQEVKTVKANDGAVTAPVTMSRTTKTSVQLNDGGSMVISGLVENDTNLSRSATPGLSSIPVLGWLFKNQDDTFSKKTLMVFITARIMRNPAMIEDVTKTKRGQTDQLLDKTRQYMEKEFPGMSSTSEAEKLLGKQLDQAVRTQNGTQNATGNAPVPAPIPNANRNGVQNGTVQP